MEITFYTVVLALLPPLLAIGLAVATKQVLLSLFAAVYVGALMLAHFNPWEALYSAFFTYILPGFNDTDHQRILCLTTFCGGFSLLLERNGGTEAFASKVHAGIGKTARGAQIIAWLAGIFIWFSDSTNPVFVGPVCRPITDKAAVSREKLAYIVDSTTSAVPCMIPISAWGAYIIGLITDYYTSSGMDASMAQADFIASIPYQYYNVGSILMVAIIAFTSWDYGPMLKAEERARAGQPLKPGSNIKEKVGIDYSKLPADAKPSIWGMLLPVIVLLAFIFIGLFYTGDIKTNGFAGSLANGSSLRSLDTAFLLASIAAIIMGVVTKMFSFMKGVSTFVEGCGNMMEVLLILMLAWSIGAICGDCGTKTFIVQVCQTFLTPTTMCLIIFVCGCLTSFSTGSSWTVFALFTPIAAAMATSINAPIALALGAVLSGGIFGDHCSPISDTTVMSSIGSECDHIDHVSTQLPYALGVAVSSLVGFLFAGLMNSPWVGLLVTVVLIAVIAFCGNKFLGKGKKA